MATAVMPLPRIAATGMSGTGGRRATGSRPGTLL
ncbi:hypothetical protein JOF53_008463 [Crossiella equi]|uniref:Uncharacterized protein n=1 Tax=Crossiella equi TaxID=130796 RepID=A0ABS5ASN6_9PSEU|nr:hypothetical protein [Crossiella equi]